VCVCNVKKPTKYQIINAKLLEQVLAAADWWNWWNVLRLLVSG